VGTSVSATGGGPEVGLEIPTTFLGSRTGGDVALASESAIVGLATRDRELLVTLALGTVRMIPMTPTTQRTNNCRFTFVGVF
jgi:hypothetical protein